MHIMHISPLKYNTWIEKPYPNDDFNYNFFVGEVISKTRASGFIRFPNARKQNHSACCLMVSNVSRVWKPDETLALIFEILLNNWRPFYEAQFGVEICVEFYESTL